jgi:hypothetical protein
MNKKQKLLIFTGSAIVIASFIIWYLSGMEMLTHYAPKINSKNKLFSMTEEEFIWGLDLTLIISGAALLVSGYVFNKLNKKM